MASNKGGGWSQDFIDRFRNVPLPERLKCGFCGYDHLTNCFSQSQLNKFRQFKARNGDRVGGAAPPVIRCLNCTGEPPVELECKKCNKVKGINEFSRSQRRRQGEAVCFNCSQDLVEGEPPTVLREQDWDVSTVSGALSNRFEDEDDGRSRRSGLRSYFVDDDDDEDCSVGGGVWIGDLKANETQKQVNPPIFMAFDPNGYRHLREVDTPPTTSASPNALKKFAKVPGMGGRNLPRISEFKGKTLPAPDDDLEALSFP